ncbi:hypothetical protein AR457_10165 [Streptomyces agglomeratus]|uniref:hypothetical protein n=1 Tax=Streptomyces agglomeratus TaxID=285458 RepID=UPI00085507EE|nr:hypothetical protein [Streptomyces agglomeratus]OEJ41209.1 hypothetical protein BGK70_26490 [Streptomyces agglomeratus]OEJ44414.1 hypothetical protein AR457_10165 [Streptomyces agglomeratus]
MSNPMENAESQWYEAFVSALSAVRRQYQLLKSNCPAHPLVRVHELHDITSRVIFLRVIAEGHETATRQLREMEEGISWMQHEAADGDLWDEAA